MVLMDDRCIIASSGWELAYFGKHIPVHDAVLVAVCYTLDKLVHEALQSQPNNEQMLYTLMPWDAVLLQILMMLSMNLHQFWLLMLWDAVMDGHIQSTVLGAEQWTFMSRGSRGKFGPFPILSMNFFRSVLRYSNTCNPAWPACRLTTLLQYI